MNTISVHIFAILFFLLQQSIYIKSALPLDAECIAAIKNQNAYCAGSNATALTVNEYDDQKCVEKKNCMFLVHISVAQDSIADLYPRIKVRYEANFRDGVVFRMETQVKQRSFERDCAAGNNSQVQKCTTEIDAKSDYAIGATVNNKDEKVLFTLVDAANGSQNRAKSVYSIRWNHFLLKRSYRDSACTGHSDQTGSSSCVYWPLLLPKDVKATKVYIYKVSSTVYHIIIHLLQTFDKFATVVLADSCNDKQIKLTCASNSGKVDASISSTPNLISSTTIRTAFVDECKFQIESKNYTFDDGFVLDIVNKVYKLSIELGQKMNGSNDSISDSYNIGLYNISSLSKAYKPDSECAEADSPPFLLKLLMALAVFTAIVIVFLTLCNACQTKTNKKKVAEKKKSKSKSEKEKENATKENAAKEMEAKS